MALIQFLKGSLQGQSVELERGGTFGAGGRCEVRLADPGVTNRHATLRFDGKQWVIKDLRTKTGTLVNGQAVKESAVQDGDIVELGEAAFRFRLGGVGGPSLRDSMARAESAPDMESGDKDTIDELKHVSEALKHELATVIVGQEEVIEEVLLAIFCRAHALLVGVPGLAKTLLVSTLSEVLDLQYKRIQFTPDLMPADITGTEVLEEDQATGKRHFKFVSGPIFTNLLLADEINRTPPKTQAALLEAMQERHVTVGQDSFVLPDPFFVLATQNPIEQEGTYPLPEAQLDRFMFNIVVGYPTQEEEESIIRRVSGDFQARPKRMLNPAQIQRLQAVVRRVPVADHVVSYAATLARATRPKEADAPDFVKEYVGWGAGPRAGIFLILAAKARAILQGRYHATTADVQKVAFPVLRHRVITTFNAEAAGVTSDQIIQELVGYLKKTKKFS
ncbi:MAG: AAA family ATPase [Verrucomicrobiota bacterium]